MAESIVDQILEAARKKGEELLADAQQRYDADLQERTAALERDIAEQQTRGRRQVEEAYQQQLSTARLEQRRKQLTEKRRLLDQVYEQAWQRVTEGDRYRSWLDGMLGEHATGGDKVVVAAREHDRFTGELSDLLRKHNVTLSDERGHFRAGFIVDRGERRLNCSLDEEFRALAAGTEIEVSGILFA